MPSVCTRRSTRVFAPTKPARLLDAEAATKLLRSSKRLSHAAGAMKLYGGNPDCIDGFSSLPSNNPGLPAAAIGGAAGEDRTGTAADTALDEWVPSVSIPALGGRDKMFGSVYSRRRKRKIDPMYGIRFRRKRRRHCVRLTASPGAMVSVFVECSFPSLSRFPIFLVSILRWMLTKSSFRMSKFIAFLLSESIAQAFARSGILFVTNSVLRNNFPMCGQFERGRRCDIFGARKFAPLITVNFSALPLYFTGLHLQMQFRFVCFLGVIRRMGSDVIEIDDEISVSFSRVEIDPGDVVGRTRHGKQVSNRSVAGVITRSRSSKNRFKTRTGGRLLSSLRPSRLNGKKSSARHAGDYYLLRSRKNVAPVLKLMNLAKLPSQPKFYRKPPRDRSSEAPKSSGLIQDHALGTPRKSVKFKSVDNVKESSSFIPEVDKQLDTEQCDANILVTESDRSWREQGAIVMMEELETSEWCLAVKLDGATRCLYKVQELMIVTSVTLNPLTHAIIWTGQGGWKLEFCQKKDWITFQELHQVCFQRNSKLITEKSIPVPVMCEITGYEDEIYTPFDQPQEYIVGMGDVQRALMDGFALYDMDSEDERLLRELNTDFVSKEDENAITMSKENFEKVVSLFERVAYARADDVSDETKATKLCLHLGRSEVVSSIYRYWQKKRQPQEFLLKHFQKHCPPTALSSPPPSSLKRSQIEHKQVFRKKRSVKQLSSAGGRTKGKISLKDQVGQWTTTGFQGDWQITREAQVAATRAIRGAVLKRAKAQKLGLNADLLLYKSVMACRIAEAAVLERETRDGSDIVHNEYFL